MKISAAAVLLTVSTASAFNVSYLNQLGAGAPAAVKAAPPVNEVVRSGSSYLDNLGGAVPELVSAIEAAPAAPVAASPASAAPVAAAPTSTDYLSALASNGSASGAGIAGYLDFLPPSVAAVSGAGLTGYLDALPAASSPITGAGLSSYTDVITPKAPAAPVAAAPAPAAPAAAAPADAAPAPSAGDYLGQLAGSNSISGAGLTTHVDTLAINNSPTGSGAALSAYLGALGVNAAGCSGAGLTGYLDALATNAMISNLGTSSATGAASVTAFLENVFKQVMAMPDGPNKQTSGNTVAFSAVDGPYAMSFVKN